MNVNEATREIFWNISGHQLLYGLLVPTVAAFVWGSYRRYVLWRVGGSDARFDHPWLRARNVLLYAAAQWRVLYDRYSGIFHLALSWGMVVLFIGTVVVMLQADFGLRMMYGPFYLYFMSWTLDAFGILTAAGLGLALFKRYALRPERLGRKPDDWAIPTALLVIVLTGFTLEGLRILATDDPWAGWSPGGALVAALFRALGTDKEMAGLIHRATWWFHLVLAYGFVAYIPYSKLAHVFTSTANIFCASLEPKGVLKPIDLENAPVLGVARLSDFSWKQLFDLDACTECGRCQDACPAYRSGKPLSPKQLILDLRAELRREGPKVAPGWRPRRPFSPEKAKAAAPQQSACAQAEAVLPEIVGKGVAADAIWSCTTCRACMEECPVLVEHVPKVVDLRRYQVMEKVDFPETLQDALRSLETRAHPYRGTSVSRLDWTRDLGVEVPIVGRPLANGQMPVVDVLLWVGCTGALDERNTKVVRALTRLLAAAGVRFGVLGQAEKCCGDPARRVGNEFLFENLARENIATLEALGVGEIVTACPHCLNTLKNEYAQFGASFTVYHHSQFLARLVALGRLRLQPQASSTAGVGPATTQATLTTFHDPCYLGRYNGVFTEPRALLREGCGLATVEMAGHHRHSLCCGGGGGRAWAEETGQRISHLRVEQAEKTGASIVATACPFCLMMIDDAVKVRGSDLRALDVAELLLQGLA